MKANILIFMFMATVISSCTRQGITEEEAVDAIHRFDSGWAHKDLHAVDSVLSPSYIYFTESGGTFSRDSIVATAGENTYLLQDVSRSEYVVTLDGNTAIVSTRWKGKGVYRGKPFDEDQRCSVTLIKKNNKIQILSEHCTPIKTYSILH